MAEKLEVSREPWKASLAVLQSTLRTSLNVANILPALRSGLTGAEYLSIESKEENVDRVDALVGILLTKDYSTFERFCSALKKNGYNYLADKWMAEKLEVSREAWKASLREHHSALRTGIIIANILPALRTMLTDAEYLSIEGKEEDVDRVDELVGILLTKDYSTFERFCSALKKNGYNYLADKWMAEKVEVSREAWKAFLREHHSALRTGLIVANVLPALRSVLADAEYLSIEGKEGDAARVDGLIRTLLAKDSSTFERFCSALKRNGHNHWASQLRDEGISPDVPDVQVPIQFPIIDELSDEFALLAAKIDIAVHELNQHRLSGLKTSIAAKLKTKYLPSQGLLHCTADELTSTLHKYWDYLNFEFAQLVVDYLRDDELQKQMGIYKENVKLKVLRTIEECRQRGVQPEPPPNAVMSISVNVEPLSYSLYHILQAKYFLMQRIGLSAALFAGFRESGMSHHSTSDILLHDIGAKGFTESECHELYQKAITGKPTITLHIAKAMTIGPPRVGKTALRHNLLGLPLPEVSISTPVMKTAETVGILPLDETASAAGNELSRAAKADSDLIHIGNEDKWVLVNETSGILSLLSHLKESVDKAIHGSQIQKSAQVKDANPTPAPSEVAEPDQETAEPVTSTSTGATVEDNTHVLAAASQLYQLLQTPEIANITLPDAKLLQFLDCGGQLAYHDILPIFTTTPAVYLHVFDLTKDLTDYPEDQLCLDTAEGEVYSHARSPLSVAEMMTRSVMTIESLADKKVQLPKDILIGESPQPHVAFVGTHLDELAQKCENLKSTLDSTCKTLQSALRSESHHIEEMVMKNPDQRLPANFFPVANKPSIQSDIAILAMQRFKRRIKSLVSGVKVKVPVKWYLYQMLEISRVKETHAPVHKYGDLFKDCHLKMVVDDLMEFHTMITYFHALGLLIHACNDGAQDHSEDSVCLIFTDPSYLFENISKLFHVQFLEESRCGGSLRRLKLKGKLTEKTLRDLKVDSSQLDHKAFMDVLVHFFIGADIEDRSGNEGRTLFIPAVLPIEATTQTLRSEQSLHFVITFDEKPCIPCGVYASAITRLQSQPKWTLSTSSISRSHTTFGVVPGDIVQLFDCSSHIRVELHDCDLKKAQEHRDTVLTVVSESYCFLFHAKPTRGEPCTACKEEPYLVLGLTCHHCREIKANHIAMLEMEDGEAKAVRCQATMNAKKGHEKHMDLFLGIQHDAVVRKQHTSPVSQPILPRKRKALPPQDTAGYTDEADTSGSEPQQATSTQTQADKVSILSQNVHDHRQHLMLFRKHVSKKAAGKGRALLEVLLCDAAEVEKCFRDNPLNEEEAVQAGLIKWMGGNVGRQPPTWEVLLEAMGNAEIDKQHVQSLSKDLGL